MDELLMICHIDSDFEYNLNIYCIYYIYKIRDIRQEKWLKTPGV